VTTCAEFKVEAKRLIKACQFKVAANLVTAFFSELEKKASNNAAEMVTLIHWVTKIAVESSNLRQLSTICLTNVNTLLNKLQHDLSKAD